MPKVGMPEIRKPQLIDATMEAINAVGLQKASVAMISGYAGVSPAIINHYFGGKDGLLEATMDGIADETLTAVPQPADGVSVAPKVSVEDARIRWDLPAHVVDRRIRAVTPHPGAWTMIGDLRVKVGPVTVAEQPAALEPGRIQVDKQHVLVGTGSSPVQLGSVQPPGKKAMNAADWARGARLDDLGWAR